MTTWQNELQLGSGEIFEPEEPLEDVLGQDLFQAYLAAAYSVYLTSTKELSSRLGSSRGNTAVGAAAVADSEQRESVPNA